MRVALGAATMLGASLVAVIAVVTPWEPLPGASLTSAPVDAYFTAQQINRSQDYFDAVAWASWTGLALTLGTAALLGFTGAGRLLVLAVRHRLNRWWQQVACLAALVLVVERLVSFPTSVWIQHESRRYGLSTQTLAGWALDVAKSMGISVVLTALAMTALIALARRLRRTWAFWAAAGAAGLVLLSSFAYPLVIEPVYSSFTPLPDGPLRSRLVDLGARDGVEVSDVLVADASRRTTALNAYVSGFGATKRIVIYDTLLTSTPDRQIEQIVAHELGHATRDDVLLGTAEGALGAATAVLVLFVALRQTVLRRAVGAGSTADPAIVPVVLGLVVLVGFVAMPAQNVISRHIEARADAHALDLTRDPGSFTGLQQAIAVANLAHLTPNPVLSFWFSDHPPTLDRIGMALDWRRLHAGSGS